MKFEQEILEKTGVQIDNWSYFPEAPDYSAILWFDYYEPDTIPVDWQSLESINNEYDIQSVEPHSHGRTSSKLAVKIKNP